MCDDNVRLTHYTQSVDLHGEAVSDLGRIRYCGFHVERGV